MNALTVRGWAWANGGVGVVVVEQCNRCGFVGGEVDSMACLAAQLCARVDANEICHDLKYQNAS